MSQGAHILVIDDEQHQLDTVCRGLALYGYRCQGVQSALGALDILKHDQSVDLVLTDLTMPGRSGLALIERVQHQWPELPIVVFTGLVTSAEVSAVRQKKIALLQKPFDPETLDTTIRSALDRLAVGGDSAK